MIEKYINYKIKGLVKQLTKEEFFDYKDLENYLNLIMSVYKQKLGPAQTDSLCDNITLLKKINNKYNLLSTYEMDLFISFLNELNRKSPSFSSQNYSYLNKILDKLYESVDVLIEKYYELDEKINKINKENEDKLLLKYMLEDTKHKIDVNAVLLDYGIIDFISSDKTIDTNYKIKLLENINSYNKNAFKNYVPLSITEVIKVLNKHGYKIEDRNLLDGISANYTLKSLNDILEKIDELSLKFSDDVIAKILYNGTTVKTIENAYNKIINDKLNLISTLSIYNFWVDKIVNRNDARIYNSSISSYNESSVTNVSSDKDDEISFADDLNSEEIFKTIDYLKKYKFYNNDLKNMKTIIKIPVEKIMVRENLLSLYGIDVNNVSKSMVLSSNNSATILDQFIELDLKNYILVHLSTVAVSKSLPVIIYDFKKKEKEYITSRGLSSTVRESTEKYKDAVIKTQLCDADVLNREEYDEILKNKKPDNISPGIFNIDIIDFLENNYKINDLQYKIDDYIFSRKKVLRIASNLIMNNEVSFDEFLYIMTFKYLMNNDDKEKVQQTLKNAYDLSKQYTRVI